MTENSWVSEWGNQNATEWMIYESDTANEWVNDWENDGHWVSERAKEWVIEWLNELTMI